MGATDATGPPASGNGGSQGRRVPERVKFLAGRGKTIATLATTTAMRPGHSTQASRAGYRVPADSLADTTRWLIRPADWDHNGGDGPFSDKRLARVVFTTTLETAVATRWVRDRSVLVLAAERLRARPGRRWILAAGGRGRHGLAGDLWPPAGDIAGTPVPCLRPTRPVPRRHRPRRRLALEPGDSHDHRRLGVPAGGRRSPHRRPAPFGTSGASSSCAGARATTAAGGLAPARPPSRSIRRSPSWHWRNATVARDPRHDRTRPGLPGRPATGRRELDRDDKAARQRQLRPADLDHRLGDSRAPGNPRVVSERRGRSETVTRPSWS